MESLDEVSEQIKSIVLESIEGDKFVLTEKESYLSKFLETLFETHDIVAGNGSSELGSDPEETYCKLQLSSSILEKIVNFLKMRNGEKMIEIQKPITTDKFEKIQLINNTTINESISEFINKLNKKEITQLIQASLYLILDDLLNLLSAKIACILKLCNTTEEIQNEIETFKT